MTGPYHRHAIPCRALALTEEALADRCRFGIGAEAWAQLQTALDAEPRQLPRLRRLLTESGAFDDPMPAD